MSTSSKLRVLWYIAIFATHIVNFLYLDAFAKRNGDTTDQRLLDFMDLWNRFLTIWTVMLQVNYAILSLLLEIWKSYNKNYHLLTHLDKFRETMFAGLVWPSTITVFTIFWTLFTYDRSLIFPEYLDQVVPTMCNHILHTLITPIVFFEVVFRPRVEPASHFWNVILLNIYSYCYVAVLMFTYYERGVWLYPMFGQLYGTIYFAFVVFIVILINHLFYILQWPLTKKIHGTKIEKRLKVSKKHA